MDTSYTIQIDEQEMDDIDYDFSSVPVVVTSNLLAKLKSFENTTPEEILFLAHTALLEKYANKNADYLQIFHLQKHGIDILKFWCISNKEKNASWDEPYASEYNMCFLLPEDY